MVPICEGWEKTYENIAIKDPQQRELHFGQHDHLRYYGRDFFDRMTNAGFEVTFYTAKPENCIKYGLIRGEKIFVGKKAQSQNNFEKNILNKLKLTRGGFKLKKLLSFFKQRGEFGKNE